MQIYTTYKVKIKHFSHIFTDTVAIYRRAVDYLIGVCISEWEDIFPLKGKQKLTHVESLTHQTKANPTPKYDFDKKFYKMPSYLRRAAINEAIGKVSSYKSNLANWEANPVGKAPSVPAAGYVYPSMYREGMYKQVGDYTAMLKVYIRNTWDWLTVDLRKSDADYITKHCQGRKRCAPTLQKRGKEWFLDFPFEEEAVLRDTELCEQTVVAVDLGVNTAAAISVMRCDGTILGRHFCKLPKEIDQLTHSLNRIKKAQQHGSSEPKALRAKANGINHDIAVKTAQYIIDIAALYNADVIVFESLDKRGKVYGKKKQLLSLWSARKVQSIVANKAHRLGIRTSHVNSSGTSDLAFDGSGTVRRGIDGTNSVCKFKSGKIYNCDLSASYNIGARYFIRERIKSLDANSRLGIEAKVPQCARRSTCTLATLISLNAVLASV